MNVVLVDPQECRPDGTVTLRGRRAEHIRTILRKGVGDVLLVGQIGGQLGEATIDAISDEGLALRCVFDREPPAKHSLALVLGLPRPPVLRRVLAHATALGVASVTLLHSARVEKSYWQSPALGDASVREQLVLGLEQARDTVLPTMSFARRFRPFVEDDLAGLAGGGRVLVAHPASPPCPCDVRGRTTLIVGPEGGFVDFELDLLHTAGAQRVGLGPRILRVETAATALIARLCLGSAA